MQRVAIQVRQRGIAILLLVVTLLMGSAAVFYGLSTATRPETERDRKTTEALAQAKAALIGYAAGAQIDYSISPARLGDLPCPDSVDNGQAGASCGASAVSPLTQATRLGRLPWKTLGLPDLRDGDGERLWYAVSNNFKNNTRTTCNAAAPGATTCLNSDTRGTITIRGTTGNILYNAANTDPTISGVIAVIFSPGAVLRRQDGTQQNRTCTGGAGCDATGICLGTTTPKCDPINYLDISGTEDNRNFTDGGGNGFIHGTVRDVGNNVVVNDRLAIITYQDLMPLLERRVAREVSNCLSAYAAANFGRYPWASNVTNITTLPETINGLFGRIPDQPLTQSRFGNVPVSAVPPYTALVTACTASPASCMQTQWPIGCNLPVDPTLNSWWNNWKLQVFYGVADAYKPQIVYTQPTPATVLLGTVSTPAGCPACVTVNPPSATADKQFVVMVAGRSLPGASPGQARNSNALRRNPANYLEGENNNSDSLYTKQPGSTTFNDTVVFSPP